MRKSRLSIQAKLLAKLFSVPGVVSVGWGYKVKNGKQLDRKCIIVGVEKKQRLIWPWHKISSLTNLETDVIEVGKIVALQSRADKWRPAPGGVSIGHYQVSAGTLGCRVRVKGEQGWCILSNNHVLADCNIGRLGDTILQPGTADGGAVDDRIGDLADFRSINFAGEPNYVDCAIAWPDYQKDVSSEILGIGEPAGYGEVQLGMAVQKSGRTTGVTTGTVQQIGVTVQVAYSGNQVAMFHDQIITGCMSKGGDSGSVLLDMGRKIVGLLFAGSDMVTCYSPIEYVIEILNLDTEDPPPPDEVTKTYCKWGMHGPNKDPTNISSMVSLGMDCYTVVDKWEQVSQIRAARPNALILLRPYFTGGLATDPVVIAQQACDHAIQFLDKTKHLVIGNELNIEGPFEAQNPDSWKKMNEWVLKTAEVVRQNLPEVILHFPAVSPGVGDDPDVIDYPLRKMIVDTWLEELIVRRGLGRKDKELMELMREGIDPAMDPPGLEYCRDAIAACDILDQHVYWPSRHPERFEPWFGRRMLWHHKLFPDKYIFISECGPTNVQPEGTAQDIIEWFNILESEFPYVLGGTLFMWNWGPENDHFNYYNKPKLIGALRDATKRQFEVPTNWIFNGGDGMQARIWRRDLPGLPVQTMDVEAYLGGVVCSEMYCSWLLEALKVQAVAARAYVMYHREHGGKHPSQGADLCTETCCQQYRESNITDKSIRAVTETRGIHLLDASNKVIQAQYISKCGLGPCPYCEGRPGHDGKQWPGRMCQYGAKVSAEQGKSWREILKFYYPHAHLSDEETPSPPPPEADIGEWLLEGMDQQLRLWHERVEYNPHTSLARAARNARPPLGLPFSKELRKTRDSKVFVHQFFWTAMAWCRENEYDNIHIVYY